MTDSEYEKLYRPMIEAAADLIDLKGAWGIDFFGNIGIFIDRGYNDHGDDCGIWNPVEFDDDAFDLLIKLGARGIFSDLILGEKMIIVDGDGNGIFIKEQNSNDDVKAAARLAIVKAAHKASELRRMFRRMRRPSK